MQRFNDNINTSVGSTKLYLMNEDLIHTEKKMKVISSSHLIDLRHKIGAKSQDGLPK